MTKILPTEKLFTAPKYGRLTAKIGIAVGIQLALLICSAPSEALTWGDETCQQALMGHSFPESIKEKMDLNERKPTLTVIRTEEGRHGGKRLVIKAFPQWYSGFSFIPGAPQGDPRWMIALFGEEVAEFFGFKLIDQTTMTIPDVVEFNSAIAKMNSMISDPTRHCRLSFYEVPSENSVVSDAEFLKGFEKLQLPIADKGAARFHDTIYHGLAVVTPVEVLNHAALITEAVDSLVAFLEAKAQTDPDLAWLASEGHIGAITKGRAIEVDYGTGNIGMNFTQALLRPSDLHSKLFQNYALLLGYGQSPAGTLRQLITNIRYGNNNPGDLYISDKEKRDKAIAVINEFISRRSTDPAFVSDLRMGDHQYRSNSNKWNEAETDALLAKILKRREELISAVREFLKKHPNPH